jgi:hypothetical protein
MRPTQIPGIAVLTSRGSITRAPMLLPKGFNTSGYLWKPELKHGTLSPTLLPEQSETMRVCLLPGLGADLPLQPQVFRHQHYRGFWRTGNHTKDTPGLTCAGPCTSTAQVISYSFLRIKANCIASRYSHRQVLALHLARID